MLIIQSRIAGSYALSEKCVNGTIGQIVNRSGFIGARIKEVGLKWGVGTI